MADIILETTVPEAYIQKVSDMLNFFTTDVTKIGRGIHGGDSAYFKFNEKGAGESQVEFGERFIKEFMIACLGVVEASEARVKQSEAINAITPDEVPSGSIG